MKKLSKILIMLLISVLAICLALTACTQLTPESEGPDQSREEPNSEQSETQSEEQTTATYNVIFALATVPPVLGALDSIENGYPTYAIIERGKTYSGIDSLDYFHNAGFDVSSNKSSGFTTQEFNDMVDTVKELKGTADEVFFNFYVQDGTALKGAAVAANAELDPSDFHIYMCEDGTGAYTALSKTFVKDKEVTEDCDEVWGAYVEAVKDAKAEFDAVMAKTDNKNSDDVLKYNIAKAYALASLPSFTYYLQDEATVVGILESAGPQKTKLLSAFSVDGYTEETEYRLNLKYQKISEGVEKLSQQKRIDYLTLMYGEYYEDTYAALTRTERADKSAPASKLVYIGTRHSGYPKLASNSKYGIGGLSADAVLPASYQELDQKYKTPLLFGTEADYSQFLDQINDAENYSEDVTDEAKTKAQVACFNNYIDYIFNLKLTFALYGEQYDIIMKGHPREPIGDWQNWGNRYKVTYGEEQTYVYDELMDNVLLAFHANDSVGKYIGMVPYGTAAENLAYLGADISICGLPSSTYNGYDTDVDVVFILAETDEDIVGTGKETAASQVKERYEAGNLTYTDSEGREAVTEFINIGRLYKILSELARAAGDTELANEYLIAFNAWLEENYEDAVDIDGQGFPVYAVVGA